ncbi:oxygen-independent coproporphyrinogen-3 oxidase [Breoghania corrubedonensis]|uniref:Coproporphyrinogen-III oxidase n=1 Tax=Breoghania corrubedonensis TaxID=665038 RepID=A0A2T5VEA7_9HYPH|nr:oxygen-independent coproporphyrinogen III oxidase [Breoghania corrubedonensis]PTW62092.1 oxygen-independent coproporphyrinogen-3 oxidase [Breoghania corrubedonensis]
MTPIEARYANRNVPRYTSYPTAPHFSAQVDAQTYAGWLAELPERPVSLYLHVPFCREICHYCGCNTKASRRDGPIAAYGETLAAEIRLVRALIGAPRKVSHIHWGGGTPSLMPRTSFLRIVETVSQGFEIAPDCEHAIELDPRTVTRALADTLALAGITRTSLGVQDFDPTVQEAIGRIQPWETVAAAVDALKGVGLDAMNFDLMYGLPRQSEASIRRTAQRALELAPSRIALFGYAHVPWFKKNQTLISEADLPDASARRMLAEAARDEITAAGYVPIGLDHFARRDDTMAIALADGTLHRNFQGYTTDSADMLIGFGASSIGRLPQGYVQNAPDVAGWQRAVDAGRAPIVRGVALDADDRARADIIEALMTNYEVDVEVIAQRHAVGLDTLADGFERLGELVGDGLVEIDGWRVTVTETGQPFVRVAAAAFDSYLAAGQARHSVAI